MTRRLFLESSVLAAAGTAGLLESSAVVAAQPGAPQTPNSIGIPTLDTQMKFNPDGTRRPFRGNTIVCHLQPQGQLRDAVDALALDIKKLSMMPKIAVLPPESFHMTVYPGANDQARDITGWPSDLPITASIDECSRKVEERIAGFRMHCDLPIRMIVDRSTTIANPRASTLRMVGANAEEEKKIRTIRDRHVDVFQFKDRQHDQYGFHITLAYQLQPFTPPEQEEYGMLLRHHVPLIVDAAPVVEFANPEFCTFPDMYRFDIRKLLAT